MIEFCKATEDRDTCLLRRGHIEDHEYGDQDQLVALAWQAGVDRVFTFLDRFNLMDKDELAEFRKAFPFIGLPEEQKPLTPEQQAWAQGVVNRLKTAPAEVDEAARQRAQAATATHRCKVCGALWKLHPADPQYPPGHPLSSKTWSCVAPGPRRNWGSPCGKCCDMAPMGEQIEALSSSTVGLPSAAAPQVLVETKLEKPKYTLAQVRSMEFLPADWTRADSERLLPLPEGWRWLKGGERILAGDVCHDPRREPAEVVMGGTTVTNNHHPIRRITTRAVLDPLQWALCKHDILKRNCKECSPSIAAPTLFEAARAMPSSVLVSPTPLNAHVPFADACTASPAADERMEGLPLRTGRHDNEATKALGEVLRHGPDCGPSHGCVESSEARRALAGAYAERDALRADLASARADVDRLNHKRHEEMLAAGELLKERDSARLARDAYGNEAKIADDARAHAESSLAAALGRNEELRAELAQVLAERDGAVSIATQLECERDRLCAELAKVKAKLKSLWRVVKCSGGPRVPEQYNVVRDIEPSERGGKQYEHHGNGGFTLEEATQKVAVLNAPIIGEES